jgi:hypothetical protein
MWAAVPFLLAGLSSWEPAMAQAQSVAQPQSAAPPQPAAQPVLHRRSEPEPPDPNAIYIDTRHRSNSQLPDDASGEYLLGRTGELVEITLQFGRLTGYVARYGSADSDRDTLLTYFFEHASTSRDRLRFITRQVHGVLFTFDGTIVRGPAESTSQDGYYLLDGEWTERNAVDHTEQRRTVSLKLAREGAIER